MEKVLRTLISKEKVFPFICCKFAIFVSEYQAFFPLVVDQKWELFWPHSFHPFLEIYLHTAAADPSRPLFFSLLLFLVEFPLLYLTSFAVLSRTVGQPLIDLS